MNEFKFKPEKRPFPTWLGPFSPTRGNTAGFRVKQGRLGTYVSDAYGSNFWPVVEGLGHDSLVELVKQHWGGGRILLLPNGYVIKPPQKSDGGETRKLIGRIEGPVVLETPTRSFVDLSNPGALKPGSPWPGPATIGLECQLRQDGSLNCSWYHPSPFGRDITDEILRGPDAALAKAFQTARVRDVTGRVRITVNGNIITNPNGNRGGQSPLYVGRIESSAWKGWNKWIEKG